MSEESKTSYDEARTVGEHTLNNNHTPLNGKSYGVRKIEALNNQYQAWYSKVAIFFSVFLVAYAYGLDGTIRYTFQSYATSSYSAHSLISTVSVVRSVAACVAQLFYARLSDIFGRVELLIIAIILYVVGTVIESQAYDVTRFAAGAILYQFGYSGVIVILQIVIADFSNINWRVFCSFVAAFPFIINTWVSGDITSAVIAGRGWSWGIGMWAFIFPLSCIPLVCCFAHMFWLAKSKGDLARLTGESEFKRLGWKKFIVEIFFWQLDIVGLLGVMLSLALILTPLTLAGGVSANWNQGHIIAPLVVGFCIIPFLVYWELKFATHPFLAVDLVKKKTVWGALMIAIFVDLVWYMQGDYLYTVLVVAFHESITSATRITSLYSFVSVLTGTGLGVVIAYVRRLKAFILFGICMWFVAMGMMIHYRSGESSHSGIIASQCLLGFGAGFFTYVAQCSIQTVTGHDGMATALSLYLSFYYIGSAAGAAISGAIWTQLLPKEIYKRIENTTVALEAYSSPLTWIYTYTWGTPERVALVEAYQYVQKILVLVGLCFCVPLLGFALLLNDPKLESVQNLKDEELNSSEDETGEDMVYTEKKGPMAFVKKFF
ncbi:hypothetical protein CANARDRAFT_172494 [[Candida] arabinofermentans NRRL YB-2248]|uniref:Major facilitator superfamily (MFS) profile domain-containing protein n=1 Tax=[Candida] arabinofermentans NRRL YB-2248 TaxID=983967 RepID=A0A1E4SZ55_9ASCO|nr:hypothetical protein CANARDRAFT_172494 [[Candida] arabinofermentans NRRL YB-2248]